MEGPNVLFITRKWAPAVGGMETYSMRLAEHLAQLTPLEVIALRGRSNGMPPRALSLLLFPIHALLALLRRDRMPEVIHLGDMALWPLGLLPNLFFSRLRIVVSAHGTDVAYHRRQNVKGWLYGRYLRLGAYLLRNATVVANSRATAKAAAETGWTRSIVIPLATDKKARSLAAKSDRLLFVGRLVERKGCGWFIQNVLPLIDNRIGIDVAGTGWDDAELAALCNSRVNHLGSLHGQMLTDAYANALAVIVPNIEPESGEYEGFGLVAPEAAEAGGIVIASDHGGLKDAVIDGETGFLVPTGDAPAWAEKIREIAGWDDEQRRAFIDQSRRKVHEHFSWERVAAQTLRTYEACRADL